MPAGLLAALAALAALAGCGPSTTLPAGPAASDAWREFEGSWTAAGSRQTIHLGSQRQASIGRLQGTLLLSGPARPGQGFLAEAIVLSDSATGLAGRAVWTDERGDQVFSELRGQGTQTGQHIEGTVVGGTGRYAGLSGDYAFAWKIVLESEDGAVQGQSTGLRGRVRIAVPSNAPAVPTPAPAAAAASRP